MIELTFTQCKQLIDNGTDLREFCKEITNQPEFIRFMGGIRYLYDIQAIQESGCASGAYMPAVTYYTAMACMVNNLDQVMEYWYEEKLPSPPSYEEQATILVSNAVECWVSQFDLTGVDWE